MVVHISAGLSLAVRLVPCPRYHGGFNEGLLFDATTLEPSRPSLRVVPRTDPGLPLMLTCESCLTWNSFIVTFCAFMKVPSSKISIKFLKLLINYCFGG